MPKGAIVTESAARIHDSYYQYTAVCSWRTAKSSSKAAVGNRRLHAIQSEPLRSTGYFSVRRQENL